jgi:hypothetical protein
MQVLGFIALSDIEKILNDWRVQLSPNNLVGTNNIF